MAPPNLEPFRSIPAIAAVPATAPILLRGATPAAAVPAALELPPALSAAPDVLGLLKALRRRWKGALFGGLLLGTFVAVAAYYLVPRPKFTARALLHVASLRPRVIFQTAENVSEYRNYQRTQVTLAKSRMVLSRALRSADAAKVAELRAKSDPVAWLDSEIKVDFPGGSEIMAITMNGDKPQDLMILVNAVTDAYQRQIVDEEQKDRVIRFDRLKALFGKYQDELRDKRKTYRELAESVGSNDKASVALRQQGSAEQLAGARQALVQLQADLRKTKLLLKQLGNPRESQPAEAPPLETALGRALDQDPALAALAGRLAQLQGKLRNVRRIIRNAADPSVRRLVATIAGVQADLAERRAEVERAVAEGLERAALEPAKSEFERVRDYAEALAEQEKELKAETATIDGEMRSLNVKSIDLHWIEDEIELATASAKTVGAEVEALTVELTAPPRIREIEKADLPQRVDAEEKHLRICGLIGLGAFLALVGGVSYLECSARRIDTVEEVVQGLRIRLIGALPAKPRRGRQRGEAWSRLLVDSVDATRMMLLHASRSHPLRTIMVTSAGKGEGKTTLSCHLATSLARAGKRTLLLDCDLRNPSTHTVLEAPVGLGVCEFLRGEATLEEIIEETPAPELAWIRAGQCDYAALGALARDGLRPLFDAVRTRFDFIIIDTAPILMVTDSLVIAQYADAAICAILRAVSRAPKVYAAYERLSALEVLMLGAVVAGTRSEHRADDEAYGYGALYGEGASPGTKDATVAKGGDHAA